MNTPYVPRARKRAVNLTLNGDLVSQAKSLTGNLSAIVEGLLAEHVANERQKRNARKALAEEGAARWATFHDTLARLPKII